jgi:hypothetical protein
MLGARCGEALAADVAGGKVTRGREGGDGNVERATFNVDAAVGEATRWIFNFLPL